MCAIKHSKLILILLIVFLSNLINAQDDCGTAIDVNSALGPFGFCETYVGVFSTTGLTPEPDLAPLSCEYENNPTAWLVIDPPPGATDMTIVIQGNTLPDPTLGIFLENGCVPPYNQAGPFSGCNFNPAEYTALVNNVNLYYIVVSSQSGSGSFSIEISFSGGTPAPANDFCINSSVLADGIILMNENNNCATSDNTGNCPMDDATVWYEIDVPNNFSLEVTLSPGTIVFPTLAIYDACGGTQIDGGNCNSVATTACLSTGTYFIEVASANGNEGEYNILAELTSCTPSCNLDATNLANIGCNPNIPNDGNIFDDIITFTLNPTGVGLGSGYLITTSSGLVLPTTATYGMPTVFSMQDGSAGSGDFTITITDADDPSCFIEVLVIDPGHCSNQCMIINEGLVYTDCINNGTASDNTDDIIIFGLNPTGQDLGIDYSISVNSGNVTPINGNYGVITDFMLDPSSAGGGDIIITITDNDFLNCEYNFTLFDPGSCSNSCQIDLLNLSEISCNNNGTSDITDDFITYELNPIGLNLDIQYQVFSTIGSVTPQLGVYGGSQMFTLDLGSASMGDVVISIIDQGDFNCLLDTILINPGPCSNAEILNGEPYDVVCNDNGTSDSSDDYISFKLNPTLINGSTYSVDIGSGTIVPSDGNYNVNTLYTLELGSAGSGNRMITIVDDVNNTLSTDYILQDPGSCGNSCHIDSVMIISMLCQDNDTPFEDEDDYLIIDMVTCDSSPIDSIVVKIIDLDTLCLTFSTGDTMSFMTPVGSAFLDSFYLQISDQSDSLLLDTIAVYPLETCSPECLIAGQVSYSGCVDNNTNTTSDDTLLFLVNLTIFNGNTPFYDYNLPGLSLSGVGEWGEDLILSIPTAIVGTDNFQIFVQSQGDTVCTELITIINPGPCSNECNINPPIITNTRCNNNGTPSLVNDDFIEFDLAITGSGVSPMFTLDAASSIITPSSSLYGQNVQYSLEAGSAGVGDYLITIKDAIDTICSQTVIVLNPGDCSPDCNITSAVVEQIECNDNGTPLDSLDDFITFNLIVEGDNLGSSYSIDFGATNIIPAISPYNIQTNFTLGPGSVGTGNLFGSIIDELDSSCSFSIEINDPGSCVFDCDFEVTVPDSTVLNCNISESLVVGMFEGNGIPVWEDNTGQIISSTIEVSLTSEGTYYFIVDYGNGCLSTDSIIVFEDFNKPIFELGNDTIINCRNLEVELVSPILGSDFGFEWTLDGFDISNSANSLFLNPGVAKLTLTDISNGCETSDSLLITLDTISPSAIIYADPDLIVDCIITSVQLTGEGEDNVEYIWMYSDNIIIQNTIEINESGIVELIAIDTINGCENEGFIEIENQQEYPVINLMGDTLYCSGDSIIIDASGSQSGTSIMLEWSNVEGQIFDEDQYSIVVTEMGSYILTLEDESNGCQNSDTINVIDLSMPFGQYQIMQTTLTDGSVLLELNSTDNLIANWFVNGEEVCSGCTSFTLIGSGSSDVILELIDAFGCTEITELSIEIHSDIQLPNAFSPNGDNVNDVFVLEGNAGTVVKLFSVFDRWGNKVFGINNRTIGDGIEWDGKSNGNKVSQGVYVYVLKYLDKTIYGEILVVR